MIYDFWAWTTKGVIVLTVIAALYTLVILAWLSATTGFRPLAVLETIGLTFPVFAGVMFGARWFLRFIDRRRAGLIPSRKVGYAKTDDTYRRQHSFNIAARRTVFVVILLSASLNEKAQAATDLDVQSPNFDGGLAKILGENNLPLSPTAIEASLGIKLTPRDNPHDLQFGNIYRYSDKNLSIYVSQKNKTSPLSAQNPSTTIAFYFKCGYEYRCAPDRADDCKTYEQVRQLLFASGWHNNIDEYLSTSTYFANQRGGYIELSKRRTVLASGVSKMCVDELYATFYESGEFHK